MKFLQGFIPLLDRTIDDPAACHFAGSGIILLTVKAWHAARAKTAQGRQVGAPASLQGLKDEEEA